MSRDTVPSSSPETVPARPTSAPAAVRDPAVEPYAWYALAILFVSYVLNFVDRSILSLLQEPIKHELGLSDAQLGLLSGFAFALFYATLGIPIARLADRTSRVRVIAAAIFVWSLMTALCGAAVGFVSLLVFRIGVGVGEAGGSPPAHSLISDYFPPARRGTALGIYSLGIPIGVMVGFLAGGWITHFFGWRRAFVAVGLPGVLFALVVLLTLREPPRGSSEGRAAAAAPKPPPLRDVFGLLWSRRSFRHLAWAGALHAFVGYGVGGWLPPFFMRSHGMSAAEVGTWVAILSGTVGAAGTFLGGWLGDRLGARDRRWYMWVCAISLVAHAPFAVSAYLVADKGLMLVLLILPALLGPIYTGPSFAMTQSLVPISMRAAAAAVLLFVFNLIGMGLGPTVVGMLSDLLRPRFGADSLRWAMLIALGANLWAALHYLLAARTLRQDLDRAGEGA